MPTSEMIYNQAARELGVGEWAEGSNPKVVQYYADAGHSEVKDDAVPWCAAFVGSILAKTGTLGTGSLMARSYETWGDAVASLDDAQRVDVVVLSRTSDPRFGHVGFYHGHGAGKVHLLGGNQNDQVNVSQYAMDRVVAIRRASQPRKAITQSSTIQASQIAKVAGTAAPVVGVLGGIEWPQLLILCGLAVVILISTGVIDVERFKRWKRGDK